jgi:hypothetical protein
MVAYKHRTVDGEISTMQVSQSADPAVACRLEKKQQAQIAALS